MPAAVDSPSVSQLTDLSGHLLQHPDVAPVLAALAVGNSATVDGAWGSSAGLLCGTLAQRVPRCLVVVIAHPGDLDGWFADLTSFTGREPLLFPAWDSLPAPAAMLEGTGTQRLRLLRALEATQSPQVVLTTFQATLQPVPDRAALDRQRRILRKGETLDPEALAEWLVDHGYHNVEVVELPGEFSRRGGIVDLFSPDGDHPVRLEFFGDELESLRHFDAQTQRSLGQVENAALTGLSAQTQDGHPPMTGHLSDYLPPGSWTVLVEQEELLQQGRHYLDRLSEKVGLFTVDDTARHLTRTPSVRVSALPSPSLETSCHLHVESVERISGDINRVRDELDSVAARDRVLIACATEAECKRLGEVLAAGTLAQSDRLHLVVGHVHQGFRLVDSGLVVLGGQALFQRDDARTIAPRRKLESRAIDSFVDLTEGDLVVHVGHGIARYRGMQMVEKNGRLEEHLQLEFRDGVKLLVPATRIDVVQKYVGATKTDPELSKLGGTSWARRKEKVEEAVRDLAVEMIELQATREAQTGTSFPPDSDWQRDFEAAFPYQETPDQLTSLAEIKADMERARPMDRLLCGDVGYGKTELALRAAFKTIDNGRQVAVLVPTTVLAEQHFRTFRQRLAEYPFVVECLSRFRTQGEQRRIIERLNKGGVDIAIGTHRLVSADVRFKDLGLVIIDEEQRFGVDHKEKLKRLRQTVDVLTMTATPIPRTLHLSLLGIRDISNLETPPADRLAIETRIQRYDPTLIRHAILRELNREGQVYFVHNRVYNIEEIRDRLSRIVPEAKFAVVHGQMHDHEMEEEMLRFVRRDADVLVATTIIESGLDIPNANTIFINDADNFGLADLHQLRGRVGRYRNRAYAYLLLDGQKMVSPDAGRRLKAIEEYTELGAGFKIALRDLEIRGAGNILGNEQSGHIAAVGYEMYCQLLENAVRQMRNQPVKTPLEVTVDVPWTAYLPRTYVPAQRQRIEVYRRLARVRSLKKLEDFRTELCDRYGPIPEVTEWLLRHTEVRLLAARWQIAAIRLERLGEGAGPTDVVFRYRARKRVEKLAAASKGELRVVDDNAAYMRLPPRDIDPEELYAKLTRLLNV